MLYRVTGPVNSLPVGRCTTKRVPPPVIVLSATDIFPSPPQVRFGVAMLMPGQPVRTRGGRMGHATPTPVGGATDGDEMVPLQPARAVRLIATAAIAVRLICLTPLHTSD